MALVGSITYVNGSASAMALTKEIPGSAPAITPTDIPPTSSRIGVSPNMWANPIARF